MRSITVGTGFSGIGTPDLAARLLGMTVVWQIEKDEFCQKVLRKNFPTVPNLYGDIYDAHPCYVDVEVFGFPCQPFSIAGKQLGEKDERYLIPEMLRVIDETRPRIVLLENVPRFASLNDGHSFKHLLEALAEMGFDAEWGHLSAADVGAPHKRERWWLLGYTQGINGERGESPRGVRGKSKEKTRGGSCYVGHAPSEGLEGSKRKVLQGARMRSPDEGCTLDDTKHGGCQRWKSFRRGATATVPSSSPRKRQIPQPRLGRIIDGDAGWLDGFRPYPAGPGATQHDFEPPRVTTRKNLHAQRVKALGNGMAFDAVYVWLRAIRDYLMATDD